MADSPTALQLSQIGLETDEGTAVPATKRVVGLSFTPEPQGNVALVRPMGYFFPTVAVPGKFWTQGKMELAADYNALAYAFDSFFRKTTATAGSGVTYDRNYVISSTNLDPTQTYTLEHGSRVQARQVVNAVVNELGFDVSREAFKFDGAFMAKRLTEGFNLSASDVQQIAIGGAPTGGTFTLTGLPGGGSTVAIPYNATAAQVQIDLDANTAIGPSNSKVAGGPLPTTPITITFIGTYGQQLIPLITSTSALTGGTTPTVSITKTTPGAAPTEVAPIPIAPGDVDLCIDLSAANIGTTPMQRGFKAAVKLGNRNMPVWALNSSESSWVGRVAGVPSSSVELTLGCDTQGTAFLTQLYAGQPIFVSMQAVGNTLSGGGSPSLRWDMCVLLDKPQSYEDDGGVWAVKLTGQIAHDVTWGKAMHVQLTNALSGL